MTIIRTYSELIKFPTFEERYRYLKLDGRVGEDTFGFDRYLNQIFYKTPEWLALRDYVIVRDNGCDLGLEGYDIIKPLPIYVHHMNPITKEDILERSDFLLNPDYLICTTYNTHKAIHYGDLRMATMGFSMRTPNDTCPWKT